MRVKVRVILILVFVFVLVCTVAWVTRPKRASWYGPGFHENKTASGEIFDMYKMTAAHKTLPFGTRVRVTYKEKSVVVRINDRGPYVKGRDIDLSYAAAKELGILEEGVVKVKLKILKKPKKS